MSKITDLEVAELQVDYTEFYTDEDIERRLSNLPRIKYAQGDAVVAAHQAMLLAKQELEKCEAQAHLLARKDDSLTSEADRKQWAKVQPDVVAAQTRHIVAQGEYKAAELKYQAIEDLFQAVRKLANIRIEQNKDQGNAARYGRPPEDS